MAETQEKKDEKEEKEAKSEVERVEKARAERAEKAAKAAEDRPPTPEEREELRLYQARKAREEELEKMAKKTEKPRSVEELLEAAYNKLSVTDQELKTEIENLFYKDGRWEVAEEGEPSNALSEPVTETTPATEPPKEAKKQGSN